MRKLLSLAALLTLSTPAFCADTPAAAPKPATDAEAEYTQKIEQRTGDILKILALTDAEQTKRVHDIIMAQYRALNGWHDAHDVELKTLAKTNDEPTKQKVADIKATLKKIHDDYIAALSKNLTPTQVEAVKDKMTYGKVDFTFRGYLIEYPGMNDAQKAKVLAFLKDAREEGMDGGSSKEKDDIFNRFKGRINNYLSKEGVTSAHAEKAKADKSEKKPAATEAPKK